VFPAGSSARPVELGFLATSAAAMSSGRRSPPGKWAPGVGVARGTDRALRGQGLSGKCGCWASWALGLFPSQAQFVAQAGSTTLVVLEAKGNPRPHSLFPRSHLRSPLLWRRRLDPPSPSPSLYCPAPSAHGPGLARRPGWPWILQAPIRGGGSERPPPHPRLLRRRTAGDPRGPLAGL
jgi:hypothetical protein